MPGWAVLFEIMGFVTGLEAVERGGCSLAEWAMAQWIKTTGLNNTHSLGQFFKKKNWTLEKTNKPGRAYICPADDGNVSQYHCFYNLLCSLYIIALF